MLPPPPPAPTSESITATSRSGSSAATAKAPRGLGVWISLALILLVNLVPILGVALLQWSAWAVLLLFWIENALIGAITLLRMLISMPGVFRVWLSKLFFLPFFSVHYGVFCIAHLSFLLLLFEPGGSSGIGPPWSELPRARALIVAEPGLLLASLALAGFLLIRMLFEFVLSGHYRDARPQEEMMKPYGRIIVLHATLIISGVLIIGLNQPGLAVVVLVGLKLAVELGFWKLGERAPIQGRGAVEALPDQDFAQRLRELLRK